MIDNLMRGENDSQQSDEFQAIPTVKWLIIGLKK